MTDRLITAHGGSISHPYIVATEPAQYATLVDLALQDPQFVGITARTHHRATFHVQDSSYRVGHTIKTRRWLTVGFFAQFGGILFVDETTPEGEDWAWLARRPRFLHSTPAVYYDHESSIQFPPACVMPVDEIAPVALEWVASGQRPTSVEWLAVNSHIWKLDGAGDIASSPDMT